MRRVQMGLTVCLLLGAAAALLLLPETAAAAAGTAVELCLSTLLPSLFPYFVLTELWVLLGAAGTLGRRAGRWMGPLFHLPGAAAPALLLGAIGGYPVGAQAVGRLYDQGALTRTEAEQTLLFCNNAGPAFVLGVVGGGLFGSPGLGAALLAIHLGSALLLGMLLRPEGRPRNSQARSDAPPVPFQTALPLAVRAIIAIFSIDRRAFIKTDTEKIHCPNNGFNCAGNLPLVICILNPEEKNALALMRQTLADQSIIKIAQMDKTRRRRTNTGHLSSLW